MGRLIEIGRAFVAARWGRRRWPPPVADCPIETAAQFEDRFAERNVLGVSQEQARREAERELAGERPAAFPGYSFGLSTGTTGRPGVFLTSETERHLWVGAVVAKFLPLRLLLGADVALVLKHNNRLYMDAGRLLRLHYFNAGAPVGEWAERLCALSPQVLIGPPGVLEQIAVSAAFERHLFRPQVLLAGAEPLFPQDRATLTDAFGVQPRVIYQAKEGFLGAECKQGGIHLNEDLIRFEDIEVGRRRFVPVITDFTRTSQVYRRFRLDDILIRRAGRCACGKSLRLVEAVEGRAQDVLLLLGGSRLFPHEVNALLQPHIGGRDYQVSQVSEDEATLAVAGGTPTGASAALARYLRVAVQEYEAPAPAEKRRRVRRMFDLTNAWLDELVAGGDGHDGASRDG